MDIYVIFILLNKNYKIKLIISESIFLTCLQTEPQKMKQMVLQTNFQYRFSIFGHMGSSGYLQLSPGTKEQQGKELFLYQDVPRHVPFFGNPILHIGICLPTYLDSQSKTLKFKNTHHKLYQTLPSIGYLSIFYCWHIVTL